MNKEKANKCLIFYKKNLVVSKIVSNFAEYFASKYLFYGVFWMY